MDRWGHLLKDTVHILAEMLAIGLGMKVNDFTSRGSSFGPHLLAPTGSDLKEFGKVGTVLAGNLFFFFLVENSPPSFTYFGSGHKIDARAVFYISGFHYDLNFLTIHGKSRYPGLFIWRKDGKKMPVKIPQGKEL